MQYQAMCMGCKKWLGVAGTFGRAVTEMAVHDCPLPRIQVYGVCSNCEQGRDEMTRDCMNQCAARGLAEVASPATLNL